MDYPEQPADPKTPQDLEFWLQRRREDFPGQALSAREMLMVNRIRQPRHKYSEM